MTRRLDVLLGLLPCRLGLVLVDDGLPVEEALLHPLEADRGAEGEEEAHRRRHGRPPRESRLVVHRPHAQDRLD